jgi:hypothetical protein
MELPVMPPVAPMLAKPVAELPEGPYSFASAWDGLDLIVWIAGFFQRRRAGPTRRLIDSG